MAEGILQWKRQCRLVVGIGKDTTEALDFSEFRIRFAVKQAMVTVPGTAEIYVYNVSRDTCDKIREEGQDVILEAGYQGNMAVIFRGQLRQRVIGRESQTDTYLRIVAASADQGHVNAVINTTLAAGSSPADVQAAIGKSYEPYGVTAGYSPALPETKLPRGKVMYGAARDYLSEFSNSYRMQACYDNSELSFIPQDGARPEEAIEINVDTGMIGMPMMTVNGLVVSCLLNPNIGPKLGGIIHINNDSIQYEAISTAYAADPQNDFKSKLMQDANGFYRIISREHVGDTRGNQWYTQLICDGINATLTPKSGAAINAVDNQ